MDTEPGFVLYPGSSVANKLLTLDAAAARRDALRREGRLVVMTNGVFDLLHPGHLHSLQAAAKLGVLFVALNGDKSAKELKGPSRPVENERTRADHLSALPYVDTIVIFDNLRLTGEILALKPDVYCKSGDYTLEKLDPGERAALEEAGARIEFMPFVEGLSTTEILRLIEAGVGAKELSEKIGISIEMFERARDAIARARSDSDRQGQNT